MYDLKCSKCGSVIGQSSIADQCGFRCNTCSQIPSDEVEQGATSNLEERIALLESDVIKVTTVMVGKGDLQAKDIAVAVEAVPNEEPIEKP